MLPVSVRKRAVCIKNNISAMGHRRTFGAMFNNFFALITKPSIVLLNTAAGTACMVYLQDAAVHALEWYIPCICAVICDLVTGLKAARWRKEEISMSAACRRTISKILVYLCWVLMAVTISHQYNGQALEKWIMGAVLLIEVGSCLSNILEPHGIQLKWTAILDKIGNKAGVDKLGDIIHNEPKTNN